MLLGIVTKVCGKMIHLMELAVRRGKKTAVDFKANFYKTRNMDMADLTGLTVATISAILRMECSMDKGSITFLTSRRHTKVLL